MAVSAGGREHRQRVLLVVSLGSVLTSGVCDAPDRCTLYSVCYLLPTVCELESCARVSVHSLEDPVAHCALGDYFGQFDAFRP